MQPTRRALLAALGLGTAGLAVGCEPAPDTTGAAAGRTPDPDARWAGRGEPDDDAFPAGVQAGDPLPDGLRLWTRYAGTAGLSVALATWVDGAWQEHEPRAVAPDDAGYAHHDLQGLLPDQPLAYQFVDAAGARSPVGHARTALADDQQGVVRLGLTSCCDQEQYDAFPALSAALGRGPLDAWLWLGDTGYFDRQITLEEYRAAWQAHLARPDLRAVGAGLAAIHTWDDHEVVDNWSPDDTDPDRIEAAWRAFLDSTPVRPDTAGRLWRSLRFGATAEVFVLDTRGERDPDAGRFISEAQLGWLAQGLAASPCRWRVVMSPVPLTALPDVFDNPTMLPERWEGYPEQRQQLLEHLAASGTDGLLFVTGDVHFPALTRVEPAGPLARVFELFTGPAASRSNPLGPTIVDDAQYLWADQRFNAVRLVLHPAGLAEIVVVGEADETIFRGWIDDRGELLAADWLDPVGSTR